MTKRISIQIATKDRHSELALLLQSLRTQNYQAWDLVILDQCQTSINDNYFLSRLLNQIRLENHYVNIIRQTEIFGVCQARNRLLDEDYFNNPLIARLDDDVLLEYNYLERLVNVIAIGYDIASGVTPVLGYPTEKRKIDDLGDRINRKMFDVEGNLLSQGDDCGVLYLENDILPTCEFRSNALMTKKVADTIRYPNNLSPVGFREEGFFSTKALYEGFNIGVDTAAIAWHLVCPVGGVRYPDYAEKVQSDDKYYKKWLKEQIQNKGVHDAFN